LYLISLENITLREIKKSWIEKTSTEDLKSSEFGKMLSRYMFYLAKYLPIFHSNSKKWLQIALTLLTAFRETSQKVIVDVA